MRNHLGQYECRLCLTLHNNEGNYLAHTQACAHLHVPYCNVFAMRIFSQLYRCTATAIGQTN